MTIDKIKNYMDTYLFNYWTVDVMKMNDAQYWIDRAYNELDYCIKNKLVVGIEYIAERNLLIILGANLSQI